MDPLSYPYVVLAGAAFLGFTAQTMSGFGGMLVALTAGAFVAPIPELLPLLVPASLFQMLVVGARHWRAARWRLLLTAVLPLMAGGAVLGYLLATRLAVHTLARAFGAAVASFAAYELWALSRAGAPVRPPLPRPLAFLGLVAAGVLQGAYATGGPPLVYVLGRAQLDKAALRATLTMAFLPLNVGIVSGYLLEGRLTVDHALPLGVLLGVTTLGLGVGEWLHGAVDERRFRLVVFVLLLLAGGALLLGR